MVVGRWQAGSPAAQSAAIDEAVPGLARLGVGAYYHHGGLRFAESAPGCLVLVDIDAEDADAARRWMDAMTAAGRHEGPASGMLAANFYLDHSGTKVLNVAEWTDAAAHQAMVDGSRSNASRGLIADASDTRPVGFTRSNVWRSSSTTGDTPTT